MIKALGKNISRDKAYNLIIKDYIDNIIHTHNDEVLEDILINGFKGLTEWSDKNLETFINDVCVFNNPKLEI